MSSNVAPTDLGGAEPGRKGRRSLIPVFVPGLRGRLLLAFFLICLFVIVAAAAGLYALRNVGQTLDQITLETVPVTLSAQELSRNAQKIVAAGPALANAANRTEVEAVLGPASGQLVDASTILSNLRAEKLDPPVLREIGEVLAKFSEHLESMKSARLDAIAAVDQKRRVIADTFAAYRQFSATWEPRLAALRSQVFGLERNMTSPDVAAQERREAVDHFNQAMTELVWLDQIRKQGGVAFERIMRAADASKLADLDLLKEEAQRSVRALDGLVPYADPDALRQLSDPLRAFRGAAVGDT